MASTTENGAEAKPRVLEIVCSAHHVHVITSTSSSLSPSQICALEHSPPPISPPHAPSFACDYLKCQSLVWATAPPIDSTLRLDIDRMISIFAGTTLHKRFGAWFGILDADIVTARQLTITTSDGRVLCDMTFKLTSLMNDRSFHIYTHTTSTCELRHVSKQRG